MFDLQLSWPEAIASASATTAETTFADLRLFLDGENVTSFVELATKVEHDYVSQPMIYLAEWLVQNWWSLLWEPEKTEDPEGRSDTAFQSRHSLIFAEHGFALPDVRLIPTGANLQVLAKPRTIEHADVRFTKFRKSLISRSELENELRHFVEAVVDRMPKSDLEADWSLIKETDAEEADFCKLMGALGLSPYRSQNRIEAALDAASESLSKEELFDLCQTATADDFVRSSKIAMMVNGLIEEQVSSVVDLTSLNGINAPNDNLSLPAYQRGLAAARQLRGAFDIADGDLSGASQIFERLEMDCKRGSSIDLKGTSSPVSGAVARQDGRGKFAIVHQAYSSRRFAAARATYFFLISAPGDRRLLTNAVTRTQQASRAFAAEMLVPQSIVRSRSRRSRLSWDQVNALAEEAMVAPEVVRHQATNCGLQVVQ